MPSIYIDTNVYLDFYQAAADRLTVFKEILERADSVLLTQQTVDEFLRNRINCLAKLSEDIKRGANVSIHTTAVVQALPSFAKWKTAKESAESAARDIAKEILSWTEDDARDAILGEFLKLTDKAKVLPISSQLIQRAQERKVVGKPPTSPDRHTVGDELIWETLLAGAVEDLVVVTRDKSFIANRTLLAAEFKIRTNNSLLLITPSLTMGLEAVGKASATVKAAEAIMPIMQAHEQQRSIRCRNCGGRDLDETGFEGGDGDEAWWFVCRRCGTETFPNPR